MASYYKQQGKTLLQVMDALYEAHGMYLSSLLNFGFEGAEGMEKMEGMMRALRAQPPKEIGGMPVALLYDYQARVVTGYDKRRAAGDYPARIECVIL